MVLTEYDEQVHIKNEREIALEEGRKEGWMKCEAAFSGLIRKLLEAGRMEDIARIAEDREYRNQLYKEFQL